MDQIELKKFAVSTALHLTVATGKPESFTPAMNDIWAFLNACEKENVKTAEFSAVPAEDTPIATFPETTRADSLPVRTHTLPALTTMQKAVLKACIELWKEETKVNSTDIGRAMRWTTPSAANAYVKILLKAGYIRRDGWYITPIYHHDGTKVAPVVQRLPDGVAKGYRPMTAKLGEVGRIS